MLLIQTTIGELYKSLSAEELKEFELYLRKMSTGKNNILIQLHTLLRDITVSGQLTKLDYSYIRAELFTTSTDSTSKLTTYTNLLINHIKEFLILSKTKEKNIYTETLWGEILIERKLKRNLIIKNKNSNVDYLIDQYPLLKEFYNKRELFFLTYQNLTKKNIDNMMTCSIDELKAFENYVLYTKMEKYMSLISNKKIYKSIVEIPNKDVIQNLINSGFESSNIIINLYSTILNLNINGNEKNYLILKQNFESNFGKLSQDLINLTIPIILNFGQSQINLGKELYNLYNYEFFKFLIQKNLLFNKSNFSYIRFNNYLNLEMNFGSVELADEILEKYKTMISNEQRESFYNLNKAKILFKKREYNSSISLLYSSSKFEMVFYIPLAKILLIKCHIMLEDIDRVMAERENFYKYIYNTKNIPEDAQRRHKLFIKYAEYMTESRFEYLTGYMRKRIETALLQTSPYFTEKEWMRERWNELKAKFDEKEDEE